MASQIIPDFNFHQNILPGSFQNNSSPQQNGCQHLQTKKHKIELIRKSISSKNLKERQLLNQKLYSMIDRSAKRRQQEVSKISKKGQLAFKFAREKLEQQTQKEKQMVKLNQQQVKTYSQEMNAFWEAKASNLNKCYRSQSAVANCYDQFLEKRKRLEREEADDKCNSCLQESKSGKKEDSGSGKGRQSEDRKISDLRRRDAINRNHNLLSEQEFNRIQTTSQKFRNSQILLSKRQQLFRASRSNQQKDQQIQLENIESALKLINQNTIESLSNCKCVLNDLTVSARLFESSQGISKNGSALMRISFANSETHKTSAKKHEIAQNKFKEIMKEMISDHELQLQKERNRLIQLKICQQNEIQRNCLVRVVNAL